MQQPHDEDALRVEPRLLRAARLRLPRPLHAIAGAGLLCRAEPAACHGAGSHLGRGVARGALQLRNERRQASLQPRHRILHSRVTHPARATRAARAARAEGRSRVVPARESLEGVQGVAAGLLCPRSLQSTHTPSRAAPLAPRPSVVSRALPPRRTPPERRLVARRAAPRVRRPILAHPCGARRCARRKAPSAWGVRSGLRPCRRLRHLLDLEAPAIPTTVPRRAAVPRRAVAAVAALGVRRHASVRVVVAAAA